MENLSIKILDALFDLCEGESYVILDKEDIVASLPEHNFETDELTEILESLTVEGFIELKYADNTEFCVCMKTKGRTLIKQSREKLQSILKESVAENVIEADPVASPVGQDAPATPKKERRRHVVSAPVEEEYVPTLDDGHYTDSGKLSRGYAVPSREEVENANKSRERRTFLAALIGAAAGSLVMDLIFLVIVLVKLAKG